MSFWRLLGVAALAALILVPGASADQSYDDAVGDAPFGPDIRRVAVVNDASGSIGIGVFYANRTCATGGDLVFVDLDVDQNAATGAASGSDYLLFVDIATNRRGIARWDGSRFQIIGLASLQAGCDPQGFDFWFFNRTEVGIARGFNFYASTSPDVSRTQQGDVTVLWNYQLSAPAPPPPPPQPPPQPLPPPPQPPRQRTYEDASRLPSRIRYVGNSIKHVRIGEKMYATMKRLRVPRVVAVACWSATDWPSVLDSVGARPTHGDVSISGFWLRAQPRWIHLAPKQCRDIQALISTRAINGQRAYALATALHERVHAQGIVNESQTNCYSVQLIYEFAKELNFVHTRALRLEQLGVRSTRATAPRGYWNATHCRDGGKWDLYPEFRNIDY